MSNQETVYLSGNSYGPEVAVVQVPVTTTLGVCGTLFRAARRLNIVTIQNLGDYPVLLALQENSDLGSAGWAAVGVPVQIVAKGKVTVDFSGLVTKPYARLRGVALTADTVIRISVNDMELINNFVQISPYGQG
jgi:hypothetical protein